MSGDIWFVVGTGFGRVCITQHHEDDINSRELHAERQAWLMPLMHYESVNLPSTP